MKMEVSVTLNLKTDAVAAAVNKATQLAMRDTVVEVQADSVKGSPWKTGNNARSLAGEVSGMGVIVAGEGAKPERVVDDSKIEGAVYSTSGYGGYLETGTAKMGARPYIKPAQDRHFTAEKFAEKVKGYLK